MLPRRADLVLANHVLADQGIVDAFGHVSVRSFSDPSHLFIARSMPPELVQLSDILMVDIRTCEPIGNPGQRTYLERFIHCSIYRARPAVQSVVHNHSPALIPFGVTGQTLRPVDHMSGFLGAGAPVFEIRDTGGDATDMLIRTPALGDALAKAMGDRNVILMRGHGATITGGSIPQAVYRAYYTEKNAELQLKAMQLGKVTYLTPEEARNSDATNDGQIARPWSLWIAHAGRSVTQ
jgi:ribulose-5-phosphate 4-epimerase/fuculose-1-phosphate aldolase